VEGQSYEWWIREGRLCSQDGHFESAAAAYNHAVLCASDKDQVARAQWLRDNAAEYTSDDSRTSAEQEVTHSVRPGMDEFEDFDVDEWINAILAIEAYAHAHPGHTIYQCVMSLSAGMSPVFIGDMFDLAASMGIVFITIHGNTHQVWPPPT
jgi:hypothetical protein